MPPAKRYLSPAFFIFAIALAVRLIALGQMSGSLLLVPAHGDMRFYDEWAQRIFSGPLSEPTAYYGLPGYAWFLGLIYAAIGHTPFVPLLLQAFADAGTALLIYLLARETIKNSSRATIIGALAALGWTMFVPAAGYTVILMPTALAAFAYWLVVWIVVKGRAPLSHRASFVLGLVIGLTATAVATILFLLPIILLTIWRKAITSLSIRSRLARTGLLFVGVVAGTSPCWVHNYFIVRDPVFLSAHSGVNFWIGNNPTANGYPNFPPGLRPGQAAMLQDSIDTAERFAARPLKRAEVSHYWSAKAWRYITTQPMSWFGLVLIKFKNLLNAFQYDDLSIITTLRQQRIILPGIYFGLLAAFGLPGLLLLRQTTSRGGTIALAVVAQLLALLPVFTTERYRLPIVPGLLIFAAAGLVWFGQQLAEGRLAQAGVYFCLLIGATLLISWPQRDSSLWALDAYNSGWQALELGRVDEAQRNLNTAYAYAPDNTEINLALGNLSYHRHDFLKAEQYYLAVLRIDPRHKSALTNLGVVYLEHGETARSRVFLEKAAEMVPNDAKAHYLLAQAAWILGDTQSATQEISEAIRLNPAQAQFKQLKSQIGAR